MTFELRVLTVSLAAYALVGGALSFCVPWLASRHAGLPAAVRAKRLAALRLLPAGGSIAAAAAVTVAFLMFEPHRAPEHVGWSVRLVAIVALATLATSACRGLRMAFATRRLTRQWFASAEPLDLAGISSSAVMVDASFPVVAVVGFRRPTLVIARSVLAACTPEELAAVLAHEQGHLDRRDNLRRLVMAVTPDVLGWAPASRRLFADWGSAAEEAADDDAARAGANGRWHLASALVKVARLAVAERALPQAMPASALYCGQNLDRRVRRLLEPAMPAGPVRQHAARAGAAIGAAAILSPLALPGLHALIELAIRTLP